MKIAHIVLVVLGLACLCMADVYMHNPRGSNNKLNEQQNNANNQNRLFDSQNNANGGYQVGTMYYYSGSTLQMSWTAQHGAADQNLNNQFIIQMACEDSMPGLRDGATTNTVTDAMPAADDIQSGRHETYSYYQKCKARERNKGLFTADQISINDNNRKTALYTRQDNAATRYGFECPEERDYYPYWHPSPWKDLVVMTSDMSLCSIYQTESQNVKSKFECSNPAFNNPKACNSSGGIWTEYASWGLAAPQCIESCKQRDNHLGNSPDGWPCSVNLTLPAVSKDTRCVFRLRYNISTSDFDSWNIDANSNTVGDARDPLIVARYPGGTEQVTFADNNGDLNVDIGIGVTLTLNVNTDQYGRTFQDRSHVFVLRPRPSSIGSSDTVYNVNVQGRRGNIVQVYPSVEYDFIPNRLRVKPGEYVHFQWTGSNNNPQGNDGQGTAGTDRNNIVQINKITDNFPLHSDDSYMFADAATVKHFALSGTFGGDTRQLNDASTYFDGGLLRMDALGTYNYMSTRNNAFSNRHQKGQIVVESSGPNIAAIVGGTLGGVAGACLIVGGVWAGVRWYKKSPAGRGF